MANILSNLKAEMLGNIYTHEEIDRIMEENKYRPIEQDTEAEEGVLKYTNTRSELWVKYVHKVGEYLILDITMSTKKRGSTKVRAFKDMNEIKMMMDYFRDNKKYDEFLIFMLGLLLARRIGDTLSLKWSHFYYENGRRKEYLTTLIEEKTDKIVKITIPDIAWKYLDWYCEVKGISPIEHLHEDIFMSKWKGVLGENYSKKEYDNAIEKQESSYRNQFRKAAEYNGIRGISTHSTRKTFGYIAHLINQYDPDCLDVLQSIYGHNSKETTKIYIDIMDEKSNKFYNDVGKYISDVDNGIKPAIDNLPVVAIRTNDLREILLKAYNMGAENKGSIDNIVHLQAMNELMAAVDNLRVS